MSSDMAENTGTIVSSVGVSFLLFALTGSQTAWLPGDSSTSLAINAIGGALASIGAGFDRVWAFVILNGIWAVLSTFNLLRKLMMKKRDELKAEPDMKLDEEKAAKPMKMPQQQQQPTMTQLAPQPMIQPYILPPMPRAHGMATIHTYIH